MYLKLRTCLMPFLAMVFTVFTTAVQAQTTYTEPNLPTVTSDKDDYAPGEVAHITGSGWTLDDSVHVEFKETPDYPDYHIYDVAVDANGNWKIDYQVEQRHLGVTFNVIVDGKQSDFRSTHVFTDGVNQLSITSPNSTIPTTITSVPRDFTINFQYSNTNPSTTVTAIAKIFSGSIEKLSVTKSVPWSSTLATNSIALSLPSTFSNGTYDIQLTLSSSNGNGSSLTDNKTGALIVAVCATPSITSQPVPTSTTYGNTTSPIFSVTTSGTVSGYQWQLSTNSGGSWANITNATSSSYTVNSPAVSMSGYQYRVVISGCSANVTSNAATLTVNPKPVVITPAVGQSKTYGTADPAFTFTNDAGLSTSNFTGSLGRTPGENVATGPYPYTLGTLSAGANYTLSLSTLTPVPSFAITKANQNITVNIYAPASAVYNSNFTVAATASSGLPVSYTSTGTLSNTGTIYTMNSGTGSGTVLYNQAGDGNYNPATEVSETVTASQASNSISFGSLNSKTYGDADFTLSATSTSGLPVTFTATGDAAVSGNTVHIAGAGSATITAHQEGNSNFAAADNVSQTFVINKADQHISWSDPADIQYNTPLSSTQLNAVISGVAGGSATGAVTYTPASGTVLNAGGAQALQVEVAETANYNAATQTVHLNVSKAATITSLIISDATYNGSSHGGTASVTGAGGLNESLSISYTGTSSTAYGPLATAPTNAGTYSATATYAESDNYLGSTTTKTFAIKQAKATITLSNLTPTYDGSGKAATANTNPANLHVNFTYNGAAAVPVNAGDYEVEATIEDVNYEGTASGTLSIAKATPVITWNNPSKITYGTALGNTQLNASTATTGSFSYTPASGTYLNAGSGQSLSVNFTPADAANYNAANAAVTINVDRADPSVNVMGYTNSYDGDAHGATLVSATGARGEDLSASITLGATYTNVPGGSATWSFAGDVNHNPATGGVAITISKAHATISVTPYDVTYDGATHAATGTATGVKGETLSGLNFNGTVHKNAGTYSGDSWAFTDVTGNYFDANNTVDNAIAQRPVTVTADAQSKVYGDNDPELSYQLTTGSLVNGDAFSGALSRDAGSSVGSYPINQGTLALSSNYMLSYASANLKITQRAITITATEKSKVYGDTDPVFSAQVTNGSIIGPDMPAGSLTRVSGEDVGAYSINQGTYTYGANYKETYVSKDFTITARPITVTPNAGQKKVYGDSDPVLAYSITTGLLVTGDVFTGNLSRAAGSDVGSYGILQGSLALSSNYSLNIASGVMFEITKRPVTITADTKTKVYGDSDPALTHQITAGSLVAGEDFSGSLTRATGNGVGTYAIQQGTVALSGNYILSYKGADLSITARPISVTADAKSKYCGQTEPVLTYKVTSGSLVGSDAFTGSLLRDAGENSGSSYAIKQGNLALSTNYTLTYIGAGLSIVGVSIDASLSGNPTPTGSAATLTAMVTPAVAGIVVTFKLDGIIKGTGTTDNTGKATLSVSGLAVNVYQVEATTGSGCGSSIAYLPIYDPNGGFVTGGGWINSPAGALKADPAITGKATFGFVAKYKKGSTTLLEGETEFQFQAGNLKFNSSSYDAATLVISGYKATYRGSGTINGSGNYKFMLAAIDGDITNGGGVDKLRMKITDAATGAVVYDNQMASADNADPSTALGGGSIVIHSDTKKVNAQQAIEINTAVPEVTDAKFGLNAFPNPSSTQFNVHLESSNATEKITLRVYDVNGRTVRLMQDLKAGQTVQFGSEYRPGIYFVEMLQGNNRKQVKLLKAIY